MWLSLIVLLLLIVPSQVLWAQQGRQPAPDITLRDINRQIVSLSSLQGRYVFIDFWTSTAVNPVRYQNLHQLRNKYLNQRLGTGSGFEIFSISLDDNPHVWFEVSRQLQINWVNVSDMQGRNSAVAQMFGVVEVPTSFLIDPQGFIISKDYSPAEVDQFLSGLQVEETATANASSDRFFRVELGLFNQDQLRFHDFTPITHLGKLEKVPVQNNTAVVAMLGPYPEETQAQHVLDAVIASGYERARMLIDSKNRRPREDAVVMGGADVFAPPPSSTGTFAPPSSNNAVGTFAPPPSNSAVGTFAPPPSNNAVGTFAPPPSNNAVGTFAPPPSNSAVGTFAPPPSNVGTSTYQAPVYTPIPAPTDYGNTQTDYGREFQYNPPSTPTIENNNSYYNDAPIVTTAPPPPSGGSYYSSSEPVVTYPSTTTSSYHQNDNFQQVEVQPAPSITNASGTYQQPLPSGQVVYSTPPPAGTMEEEFVPEIEIAYEQADEAGDNFNTQQNGAYNTSPNVPLEPAPVYPHTSNGNAQVPDVRSNTYDVEANNTPAPAPSTNNEAMTPTNCRIPIYYRDGMPVYEDKTVGEVEVYQTPPAIDYSTPPVNATNQYSTPSVNPSNQYTSPSNRATYPWEESQPATYPSQSGTYTTPNTYTPPSTYAPSTNNGVSTNRDALNVGIGDTYTKDEAPVMGGAPVKWDNPMPDIESIGEDPYINTRPNEYERGLEQRQWQNNQGTVQQTTPQYPSSNTNSPSTDGFWAIDAPNNEDSYEEDGFNDIPASIKGRSGYHRRIAKQQRQREKRNRKRGKGW